MSPVFELDLVEGAARRLLRLCILVVLALAAPAGSAAAADCRVPVSAAAVTVKRVGMAVSAQWR